MMSPSARVMAFAAAKTRARSRDLVGRRLAPPLLLGERKTAGGSRRSIAMASSAEEYLILEDRCVTAAMSCGISLVFLRAGSGDLVPEEDATSLGKSCPQPGP